MLRTVTRPRPIHLGSPVEWGHPLNQGLLARWLAPDVSLRELTGRFPATATNASISLPHPYLPTGGALVVTGANGGAAATVGSAFDGLPNFSASMLCYRPTGTTYVSCGRTGAGKRFLIEWVSSLLYGLVENGSSAVVSAAAGTGIGWHQCVLTFDGSLSATARIKLYLDGVPLTVTGNANTGATTPTGTTWNVGNDGNTPSTVGNAIAECVAWGRTLSDADVASLYDETLRGYPGTLRRVRGRSLVSWPATTLALSDSDAFTLLDLATIAATALGSDGASLTESAPTLAASLAVSDSAALADPVTIGSLVVTLSTAEAFGLAESVALAASVATTDSAALADLGIAGDVTRHGPARFASTVLDLGVFASTLEPTGPDASQSTLED